MKIETTAYVIQRWEKNSWITHFFDKNGEPSYVGRLLQGGNPDIAPTSPSDSGYVSCSLRSLLMRTSYADYTYIFRKGSWWVRKYGDKFNKLEEKA